MNGRVPPDMAWGANHRKSRWKVGDPSGFVKRPWNGTQARCVGGAGLLRCCFRVLLPAAGVLMRYYLVVVVERRALTGAGNGAGLGCQAFGAEIGTVGTVR